MKMDVVELTKRTIELAAKDNDLKEKMKETTTTIVMELSDCDDTFFTFSIENGELSFFPGQPEHTDFQFEIAKDDYTDLITGKKAGLILMATKKIKMVKGSMAEMGKIIAPMGAIPRFGKQVVQQEND
jgi:putative sterol carrier protein